MTSCFVRRILKTALCSPGFVAATLFLTCLLTLGTVFPIATDPGIGTPLNKQSYETDLASLQGLLSTDYPQIASEESVELTKQEVVAIEEVLAASDATAFIEAASRYYDLMIEDIKKGYLVSDLRIKTAWRDYLKMFAAMDHPSLGYSDSMSAPTLYYLSVMVRCVPYQVFYLPTLVAIILGMALRRKTRLLSRAPVSNLASFLTAMTVGCVGSIVSIVVGFLPSAGLCAVKNGFGDFLYPVLFELDGAMHATTLGVSLVESVVLFVAMSIVLAVVAEFVFMLTSSSLLAGAAGMAAVLLPMFPFYSSVALSSIGAYLPFTYLQVWSVAGYAWYAPELSACPVPGASLPAALLSSALAALLLAFIAMAVRKVLDKPKGGETVAQGVQRVVS